MSNKELPDREELKWDPALPESELADAHDCRKWASPEGICEWCGAIITGSLADYDLHGYDPPDSW